MMNKVTPRVFIAATRQNDGKTTTSLGLMAALKKYYPRVGYIKPVGQRIVEVEEQRIDEDTLLMDSVYRLNCPLMEMSPIAIEPDFTRKYIENSNPEWLVRRTQQAFDRVAWEKDFVLCEGSGHAGVGAVFDFSNARAAKVLNAKVVIVSRGGIGKPIDEVALNQALFEKEGVEVIGVILNKVLPQKLEEIERITRIGFQRRGLKLLGVLPYEPVLSRPTMDLVYSSLNARILNSVGPLKHLVDNVVVGAMSPKEVVNFIRKGSLIIMPSDRKDILRALASSLLGQAEEGIAGVLLTGSDSVSDDLMDIISNVPFPVLMTRSETFAVASAVHDLTVKTRPTDTQKIEVIRNLVARHVDVEQILESIGATPISNPA
jgi:hypothetical protein